MNGDNEGNYTKISTDDFNQEIFEIKQEMLEKLWKAQHPEEQVEQVEQEQEQGEQDQWEQEQEEPIYAQENENTQTEQTGEQLVEEVVEQSEELEIRLDEISEVNIEINQAERDFVQEQQQIPQDMGMSIGE